MNQYFKDDFYRNTREHYKFIKFIYWYIYDYRIRFLYYFRLSKRNIIRRIMLHKYSRKYGLEIYGNIKQGMYLGHAHNINVNPDAIIGKNLNLSKGVTIGRESRGEREGTPIIGDNVWIGVNATIVGRIKIGNDVMIAPNTFVNFDVPDHSIVIGNRAEIKQRVEATKGYVINKV